MTARIEKGGMVWIQEPTHLEEICARETMYPSVLTAVRKNTNVENSHGTVFGYVVNGSILIRSKGIKSAELTEGNYFSSPDKLNVEFDGEGLLVVIQRIGYHGMNTMGMREKSCRLAYIDGCSDTILVMPPRLGNPVYNHLHFPFGVNKSQHTHPTIRMGIIADGEGVAYGPDWEIKMTKGGVFY